jgi:hypothetical protein
VIVDARADDVAVEANRGTRGVDEVDCAGSIQERNQWAIDISHGSEVIKEIFGKVRQGSNANPAPDRQARIAALELDRR